MQIPTNVLTNKVLVVTNSFLRIITLLRSGWGGPRVSQKGANSGGGEVVKLHENETNWTEKGGTSAVSLTPTRHPPMRKKCHSNSPLTFSYKNA